MTTTASAHADPDRLHPADEASAALLPCLLTDSAREILGPWRVQLSDPRAAELHTLLDRIVDACGRLAVLTIEQLPDDTEAMIAALTVRCWALGVRASCTRLGGTDTGFRDEHGGHDALVADVRAQLEQRFLQGPASARADGWDILAGSLLA